MNFPRVISPAAVLLLSVAHASDPDVATTWLPLAEGNAWVFSDGTDAVRVGVDAVYEDDYYWLTGFLGLDYWVWGDSEGADIWQYNSSAGSWDTLLEADSTEDWSLKVTNSYCSTYRIGLDAEDVSVEAAGQTFTGARTFGFDLVPEANVRCMAKTMQDITFAPGVGPVAFDSARGETWTLQGAKVDGEWIAAAADTDTDGDIEVTILTDAAAYTHQDTGIRCVTTPCPSTAPAEALVTVVVANTGSSAQTLDFSSSLQVDVDVYNADAEWVGSWSDDQMFTQAETSLTLEAGERKLFTRTVALSDADGEPLSGDVALAVWIPALWSYPAVWLTAGE